MTRLAPSGLVIAVTLSLVVGCVPRPYTSPVRLREPITYSTRIDVPTMILPDECAVPFLSASMKSPRGTAADGFAAARARAEQFTRDAVVRDLRENAFPNEEDSDADLCVTVLVRDVTCPTFGGVSVHVTAILKSRDGATIANSEGKGTGVALATGSDAMQSLMGGLARALEQIKVDIDAKRDDIVRSVAARLAATGSPVSARQTSDDTLSYSHPVENDVDANIPGGAASNPHAVAVIVAGCDYAKAPKVEYASRDAAVLKQYLLKTLGLKEENVISLRNPGKADLERVFGIKGNAEGQLYNYVRKGESDVFVYYTGHGAPDLKTKEAFLVPTDADPSYINLQGYPLSTLYENLAQIPAKSITVVLDACFSGAYDKGLIVQQASPLVVAAAPEPGKLPDNMTLLTSAAGDQVSSWYADKKHSLFTYWFLKGLQGEADANRDKSITIGEMKKYVSDNVSYWAQRLHNRIQTPTFSGDESRVLARLR